MSLLYESLDVLMFTATSQVFISSYHLPLFKLLLKLLLKDSGVGEISLRRTIIDSWFLDPKDVYNRLGFDQIEIYHW